MPRPCAAVLRYPRSVKTASQRMPAARSEIAIPLAISDLAAGILWLAVFTERGYLNTAAQGLGIVDQAKVYLSFENFGGLVAAIVIAESWRATAIVMVILVAGLQLIP